MVEATTTAATTVAAITAVVAMVAITYCGREELGAVSFSAFIDRAANHF
jgi:hypothetical protein